jgi:hypothetical protein
VGIGLDAAAQTVALHHRDLPAEKPLFSLGVGELEPLHLRRLGANAARLVKGQPLLIGDQSNPGSKPNSGGNLSDVDLDQLVQVIASVVCELLYGKANSI